MIELKAVSKKFGDKTVLQNMNLTIMPGEIYGLIGRNGIGKTTALSVIAGFLDVDSGTCSVNGIPVTRKNRSKDIGYLPDVPSFYDHLSVREYIHFLLHHKNPKGCEDLLRMVKLSGGEKIKSLSRGNKQRLGLAAALCGNPSVLLLDEPSSALDPQGRIELKEILLELKSQNKTILLSSHILTDLEEICDRVGFMHGGCITKTIQPKDHAENARLRIVFEKDIDRSLIPIEQECPVAYPDSRTMVIECDRLTLAVQKKLCKALSDLDNRIIYCCIEAKQLEEIYREVCM